MKSRLTSIIISINILIFVLGFSVILQQSKPSLSGRPAIKSHEGQYDTLLKEGANYFYMGQGVNPLLIGKAIAFVGEAITEQPGNLDGYLILGQIYMRVGAFQYAIGVFESALIVFPQEGLLSYFLSQCYYALDDKRMAAYFLKESIKKLGDTQPRETLSQNNHLTIGGS